MNATIARLTWRSLLGRRRALILLILPVVLLALAAAFRVLQGQDSEHGAFLLSTFGLGFLIPLLGLIAGTGAIGPEIDDGSIIYVLAKPLSRYSIVVSKLLVSIAVVTAFGVLPVLAAGLLVSGTAANVAVGYAAGAFAAAIAYCALFLLLAVVTRNAVVAGLLYALVWESVIGGFVDGAKSLSIRQWGLAITEKVMGADAANLDSPSPVALPTAVVLLVVLLVGATVYAGYRLRSIRLTSDE
jgi:ABC-2 type transport system permease protein